MAGERNFGAPVEDLFARNRRRVVGFGVAATTAGLTALATAGCADNSPKDPTGVPTTKIERIETPKIPTIDPVTLTIVSSQVATETPGLAVTPTPEATPNDFEVNVERVNFGRQIDGRNYWEFLGNDEYHFEEVLEVYTTGQEPTLRPLGPNKRVYLSQIDNITGEKVAQITNKDQLIHAVFLIPSDKEFTSDAIDPNNTQTLGQLMGIELALYQNKRTEIGGITFGQVDAPSGHMAFELGDESLFCVNGKDPGPATKVKYIVSTQDSPSSGDPIFVGPSEPITVQDPFCVKPSA